MAESAEVKIPRDGTFVFTDGGSKSYTVSYENGNVKISKKKAARTVIRDRGEIVGVRGGDEQVETITFSVHFREFSRSAGTSDANNATIMDVLDFTGNWSDAVSAGGAGFPDDEGLNYVNAAFTVAAVGTDTASSAAAALKCLGEWEFSESEIDTVDVTLEVYGGITRTGPS